MEQQNTINGEVGELLKKKGFITSKIEIEVDTLFKRFKGKQLGFDDEYEKNEDFTKDVETAFHRAVHKVIEDYIIEYANEEFCSKVLEEMGEEFEYCPKNAKEFNDLGQVSMRLSFTEPKDKENINDG